MNRSPSTTLTMDLPDSAEPIRDPGTKAKADTGRRVETGAREASASRDRAAFSILIREHHRSLLVYARALAGEPEVAKDLVQDAFVVAYQKLDEFDTARDFGAWVRGIVRHKWHDHLKKEGGRAAWEAELAAMEEQARAWDQAAAANGGRGVFALLEDCLRKLPEPMARAVDRFYLKETPGRDAAEGEGVTEAALRKRLQRARDLLRACLERNAQPESNQSHAC